MADLTEKQLQLKEETARCILNVANKVIPGMYLCKKRIFLAKCLYEIIMGLNEPSSRAMIMTQLG